MLRTNKGCLTIVGLGPGTWEALTVEAVRTLGGAKEVYVRSAIHPSIEPIRSQLPDVRFRSFDELYDTLPTLDDVYSRIADEVASLAGREDGVVYAVPGSPSLSDTTVRLTINRVREGGIPIQLIQGISFVEPVLEATGIIDASWVQILDAAEVAFFARENAVGEVSRSEDRLPWRAPITTAPLLVSYLYDRHMASGVKLWLGRYYPDDHLVQLVHAPGTVHCSRTEIPLYEVDRIAEVDHRTALLVPALPDKENVRTFAGLMNITRTLRAPGGCPWDREQTHASLKPHLLEETYEVLDALDDGDPISLAEEMGDLLFQITIHSQVAAENGEFTIEDVIESISRKLVGRHPHVFADMNLDTAQDVRNVWESFKQREKPKRASVLEQIPKGLPALPQSNLMQKRASGVGFEWPALWDVIAKVEEELDELRQEVERGSSRERQREEYGDILFALVSVARHLKIDPEEALRLANRKFAARFQYVESRLSAQGKTPRDLSAEELDALWEEAKALGTASISSTG